MECVNFSTQSSKMDLNSSSVNAIRIAFPSSDQIKILEEDVQQLSQQSRQHQQHVTTLEKQIGTLLEENDLWKNSFNETRTKLLNIEYEKSDEAKINLQRENASLRIKMTSLKEAASCMMEEYQSENLSLKTEHEKFR